MKLNIKFPSDNQDLVLDDINVNNTIGAIKEKNFYS